MTRKDWYLIILVLLGAYGTGAWLYLSMDAPGDDHCYLITVPNHESFDLKDPQDSSHVFTTINDASALNLTRVYSIVRVKTVNDIRRSLDLARAKKLPISIAAVKHSMGGQAFFTDAIVLDMSQFNAVISLDEQHKILTVQSGATWHDLQLYLNPKGLAILAMQSSDIFSVGGSLSVNAHGMDHVVGSIASTVRSFKIMLADGSIQQVSRESNLELFNLVIGGYGLFGVVLEVELEVTQNVMYQRHSQIMPLRQFPAFFKKIQADNQYGLFYAHLSTSPLSFFQEVMTYGYQPVAWSQSLPSITKGTLVKSRRFLINLSKVRKYAQILKWGAEKYIDPQLEALKSKSLLSRNEVMHDSVEYLQNALVNETDILQEYFIPRQHLVDFINKAKMVIQKSKIVVLNASVRAVHQESNFLNYAPKPMFAVVLYLNQKVTDAALSQMVSLTRELIDLALQYQGTFFLPYQLYYSEQQLHAAYPNIDQFFEFKKKYDPDLMFMNSFYAKYAPGNLNK